MRPAGEAREQQEDGGLPRLGPSVEGAQRGDVFQGRPSLVARRVRWRSKAQSRHRHRQKRHDSQVEERVALGAAEEEAGHRVRRRPQAAHAMVELVKEHSVAVGGVGDRGAHREGGQGVVAGLRVGKRLGVGKDHDATLAQRDLHRPGTLQRTWCRLSRWCDLPALCQLRAQHRQIGTQQGRRCHRLDRRSSGLLDLFALVALFVLLVLVVRRSASVVSLHGVELGRRLVVQDDSRRRKRFRQARGQRVGAPLSVAVPVGIAGLVLGERRELAQRQS